MPSDGQHTARSLWRATLPESSDSLRPQFLARPKCPGSLCHGPCVSRREKTLCSDYFEDLVPKATLLEEKSAAYHAVALKGHPA